MLRRRLGGRCTLRRGRRTSRGGGYGLVGATCDSAGLAFRQGLHWARSRMPVLLLGGLGQIIGGFFEGVALAATVEAAVVFICREQRVLAGNPALPSLSGKTCTWRRSP